MRRKGKEIWKENCRNLNKSEHYFYNDNFLIPILDI